MASVLIGDEIPLTWKSTDGLTVYFGRNGINLKTKEMVPLKDGMYPPMFIEIKEQKVLFAQNFSLKVI